MTGSRCCALGVSFPPPWKPRGSQPAAPHLGEDGGIVGGLVFLLLLWGPLLHLLTICLLLPIRSLGLRGVKRGNKTKEKMIKNQEHVIFLVKGIFFAVILSMLPMCIVLPWSAMLIDMLSHTRAFTELYRTVLSFYCGDIL